MKQKNIFTAFLLLVALVSCTSHKPSETQSSLLVLSPEQMVVDSLVQINKQQCETFSTNAIRPYDQIIVSWAFSLPEVKQLFEGKVKTPALVYVTLKD